MRFLTVLRQTVALLSRMYLVMTLTFVACAAIPAMFGWIPTIVMTGSMEPQVRPGDVLVAQPIDQDKLKSTLRKGQVLLANDPTKPGTLITHRVHELYDRYDNLTTKGDANSKPDIARMPLKNIVGYERIQIPMLGLPIQQMRNGNIIPLVVFILVTIFAQIMVTSESRRQRFIENDPWDDDPSKPRRGRRRFNGKNQNLRTSSSLLCAAVITSLLVLVGGSNAALSGQTSNTDNSFTTATSEVLP